MINFNTKLFNYCYFGGALGVSAWLLRDNPHFHFIPAMIGLIGGICAILFAISILEPNGFKLSDDHLSRTIQQSNLFNSVCVLVKVLPILPISYFFVFNALVLFGCSSYNADCYYHILKFESSAFGKQRAKKFYDITKPKVWKAGRRLADSGDLKAARRIFQAGIYMDSIVSVHANIGDVVEQAAVLNALGHRKEAAEYFTWAEHTFSNCGHCQKYFNLPEGVVSANVISVGHFVQLMKDVPYEKLAQDFPYIKDNWNGKDPDKFRSRSFVTIDLRPFVWDYRTCATKDEGIALTASTVRKALSGYSIDNLPKDLSILKKLHPRNIVKRPKNNRLFARKEYSAKRTLGGNNFPDCQRDFLVGHFVLLDTELANKICSLAESKGGITIADDFTATFLDDYDRRRRLNLVKLKI